MTARSEKWKLNCTARPRIRFHFSHLGWQGAEANPISNLTLSVYCRALENYNQSIHSIYIEDIINLIYFSWFFKFDCTPSRKTKKPKFYWSRKFNKLKNRNRSVKSYWFITEAIEKISDNQINEMFEHKIEFHFMFSKFDVLKFPKELHFSLHLSYHIVVLWFTF